MSDLNESIIDYGQLEELDPSLVDGYHVLYDREVPVELRHITSSDDEVSIGSMESIKIKVLLQGAEDAPTSIRVELSSEADLFFYFIHSVNEEEYHKIKASQHLCVDFNNYAQILVRMLNNCIREPVFLAICTLFGDDLQSAKLDLIQNMEYKYVELLSCVFERCSDKVIQDQLSYRYNSMKQRLLLMQTRIHEIVNVVKTKNPSLLLQLQKVNSASTDRSYSSGSGCSS